LFVRDEDVRLSFLYGNYTTLTSITEDEMQRIIEQRLSPQYVSVHATDLDVRAYLLGVDKKRADISTQLSRLLDAGIQVHAQIVLCPGINDEEVLDKTINDLASEFPRITSVAIVPLGLTRYNTDARLTAVTPEFCRRVIQQVSELQQTLLARLGTNFAFLGDEIYLRGGKPIPSRSHYGDLPQIEDGVGMVRSFIEDFAATTRRMQRAGTQLDHRRGTVVTGSLFAPVLEPLIKKLNVKFGSALSVTAINNTYFGGDVSVAGLLTGQDLLQAREQIDGEFVLIPKQMLKSDEDVMLDGMKLDQVKEDLGVHMHAISLSELPQVLVSR
jgi:putative radical SAM enzyme (TIGR03279 family)